MSISGGAGGDRDNSISKFEPLRESKAIYSLSVMRKVEPIRC